MVFSTETMASRSAIRRAL